MKLMMPPLSRMLADKLVHRHRTRSAPVVIEKHGRPYAVMVAAADFDRMHLSQAEPAGQ